MTRLVLVYLPLGLWSAAVLFLGAVDAGATALPRGADKAIHFAMYGVGGALAAWAASRYRRPAAAWGGLLAVFATGAVDELRQASLPYRHGDPLDWLADVAGAVFAFLLVDRILGKD